MESFLDTQRSPQLLPLHMNSVCLYHKKPNLYTSYIFLHSVGDWSQWVINKICSAIQVIKRRDNGIISVTECMILHKKTIIVNQSSTMIEDTGATHRTQSYFRHISMPTLFHDILNRIGTELSIYSTMIIETTNPNKNKELEVFY